MDDGLERGAEHQDLEQISMEEIEAEGAISLPNKEVMSLLDINANVDLGLDLAAPVDLAVAANLNVAAPIQAAASANLLSSDAQAIALSQQHGTIDQGISGSAEATAPQHAEIIQNSNSDGMGSTDGATSTDAPAATPVADGATSGVSDNGDVTDGAGGAVGGVTDGVGGVTDGVGGAVGGATGGVDSLLNGGSLLDASVNIHANADVAAPIDGAVAANANVAAPINASVAANIGSDGAVAQSLADQQVDIHQDMDDVTAEATAEQVASIEQR